MIGYYAFHSFINQIRKLCKTWVFLFILICMLIGGLIGVGVAALTDVAGIEESVEEAYEDQEALTDGENGEENPEGGDTLGEPGGPWEEASWDAFDGYALMELVIGGIILAVLLFEAVSADKNGSKIFLPADVNLLFASPMKPQSVLMFRLMLQLGAAAFLSIYLLIEIPSLTEMLGISVWSSIAIVVSWGFLIALGKLLQVLLYTIASTRVGIKQNLRRVVYGVVALLAIAWFVCWKTEGGSYLDACVRFFNGSATRLIPVWGWLKGFCMYAIEGNLTGTLLCLAALILSVLGLSYVIWHVKADFYEDAMAKSEETAALLERAQSEKAGVAVSGKRKKDRSDRLLRDGMKYGAGANVFFHKALYNRFRFAHLKIFTKTTEWYLVAAVGVSALCRLVWETDGITPVALTLCALVFFRTLGNPLEQDTGMDLFQMIPESTWAKLFWSLMGGTVNCLLDVIPALIVAVVLLGASPLAAAAWIPFIVSIDFYATCVGTFINLSVPVAAGKTLKQMVQILFIYFGLLPDIAVLAVAMVLSHTAVGVILAALINVILGLLFFLLSPLFLEPKEGRRIRKDGFAGLSAEELPGARKAFSRIGFGAAVILVAGGAAQMVAAYAVACFWPAGMEIPVMIWVLTFAPLYLIGVPLGLLCMRKVPASRPEPERWGFGRLLTAFLICLFMMYAGNLLGMAVTALVQSLLGGTAENPLLSYVMGGSLLWRILFMVILAPILEEYIFRKQLIDRMRIYGEKTAVILSAAMFGLFHGNLSQMFYAATIGLVFGYVYVRTGRLRYSIGMHMLINFLGSVVSVAVLDHLDFTVLEQLETAGLSFGQILRETGIWGLLLYGLLMIGMAVAGLILLCIKSRKIRFYEREKELPAGKRFRTAAANVGMLVFFLACMALVVMSLMG